VHETDFVGRCRRSCYKSNHGLSIRLLMRDLEIRHALDAMLRGEHAAEPNTLIRHELGLCAGNRRVDVAVINGELAGWEIKSDVDTLARLAGQADAYGRVLDRATLVTTEKYVTRAATLLPGWWGLAVVAPGSPRPTLIAVRAGELNRSIDPFSVAQLLWRSEALDELRESHLSRGLANKARHYVWERLVESLSLEDLQSVVRTRLRARVDWPDAWSRSQDDD
jgi:hypothetical protein